MYSSADYDQMAYQQMSPMEQTVYLLITIYFLIAGWKIFEKAKQPGWKAIIPIYNTYTLLKILGKPGWWLLLLFIPLINFIIMIIISLDLGKAFGKSTMWSVFLLIIFPFIGVSILAFSKAKYKKI